MPISLHSKRSRIAPYAWDEAAPGFYIGELLTEGDVKMQFTLPNVAYAGSNEGCGCGFIKEGEEGEELEIVEENYRNLANYVRALQANGSRIELFSCWAGNETSKPDFNETVSVSDLIAGEFEFKEKALYRIVAS